jgi:hypothetical protein
MSNRSISRNSKLKILQEDSQLFTKHGYDGAFIQGSATSVNLKTSRE